MNKTLRLCLLLIVGCVFVGCETSRGVGKDMENTGKNIQDTVEHND